MTSRGYTHHGVSGNMNDIENIRSVFAKDIGVSGFEKVMSHGFMSASLILTQDCNLACPFCYQPKEFRTKNEMPVEVADASIEWIHREFYDKKITITLFGGEPFLRPDLIKYIVDKWQQCNFVIVTNGLVLSKDKELRDWIKSRKNNVNITFSMNALSQVYGKDMLSMSQSVFDVVANNHGDVHYVLADHLDDVVPKIKRIVESGVGIVRLSLPKEQNVIIDHKEEFLELFKKVADYIYVENKRKIRFSWDIAPRSNCVQGEPYPNAINSFCGAGFSYVAIDWKGDIYPCDYFLVWPEFKIGDISKGFYNTRRTFQNYPNWENDIYGHCQECPLGDVRECPNAMCYAENYRYSGDILKPTKNCCTIREIEVGIYKYVAGLLRGVDEKTKICSREAVPNQCLP